MSVQEWHRSAKQVDVHGKENILMKQQKKRKKKGEGAGRNIDSKLEVI
jgi:hypothetical protein